jgi:Zn-dependent hydrolases, including glyoxylases
VWITDNVFEIKSRIVSMFVYTAADTPICFDTGISKEDIKRGFDALGFKPEHVKHVFLTHTDNDHVGGLNLFKNANVYLSIDEEQMIDRTTPRFLGFRYNPPLKKSYTLLKNGDIVQAGDAKIEALATPGHTPGPCPTWSMVLFYSLATRSSLEKVRPAISQGYTSEI